MRNPADRRRSGGIRALSLAALAAAAAACSGPSGRTGEETTPPRFSGARTILDRESQLPVAQLDAPVTVAILRDTSSIGYFTDRTMLDSVVAHWTRALRDVGARVSVVDPDRATAPELARIGALVVPSSPCLGARSRRLIDGALAEGRGVILTWLTGTRDGGCAPAGWHVPASLVSAGRADTLEQRTQVYVTIPSGRPLATDLPPGARLELRWASQVALRAPGRSAYYSDFMLNPAAAKGAPLVDAAITSEQHGRGRVVHWGFDLPHVVGDAWNSALARLLVRNSVAWAAGLPLAEVEPWPRGHAAAAVLAQDVEDEYPNARHALDSLRAARVPGTFFLVTGLVREDEALVRALDDGGEIATHTDDHQLLGGTPADAQARRLAHSQREVRALTGAPTGGLRPPEEQFDDATLEAWASAGGTYLFGANNSRAASPEILNVGGRRLVLLGRVVDDDYAIVRRAGITSPERLTTLYLESFEKVRALGGLFVLSYHSNLLARPDLVPALARVARALDADSATWLATAGDVAAWWVARADLDVTSALAGDTLVVRARNAGTGAVRDAVARVTLPFDATVRSSTGVRLLPSPEGAVRLALPAIEPGAATEARIVLDRGGQP